MKQTAMTETWTPEGELILEGLWEEIAAYAEARPELFAGRHVTLTVLVDSEDEGGG